MAERSFEAELERRFAEAPPFPDQDLFVARVTAALDRGWGFRRLLIGGLGVAGGLIGGAQVLRSGLLGRILALGDPGHLLAATSFRRLPIARDLAQAIASGASMDTEVLWMSGALALLAVGLFVTRTFKDI
jgi:hypothetical protein